MVAGTASAVVGMAAHVRRGAVALAPGGAAVAVLRLGVVEAVGKRGSRLGPVFLPGAVLVIVPLCTAAFAESMASRFQRSFLRKRLGKMIGVT